MNLATIPFLYVSKIFISSLSKVMRRSAGVLLGGYEWGRVHFLNRCFEKIAISFLLTFLEQVLLSFLALRKSMCYWATASRVEFREIYNFCVFYLPRTKVGYVLLNVNGCIWNSTVLFFKYWEMNIWAWVSLLLFAGRRDGWRWTVSLYKSL